MNVNDLLNNIDKIHTTQLGVGRIKKNLSLGDTPDVVQWCKDKILNAKKITRRGKNWYVSADDAIITINAGSYTIITAHKVAATLAIQNEMNESKASEI
ncbi:MAG: DUF3781 domain-containing protein [Oscillospiraceae bacterium]|nr:DUF3781 domain-containing protein [Oscillospiraceae bacterium]